VKSKSIGLYKESLVVFGVKILMPIINLRKNCFKFNGNERDFRAIFEVKPSYGPSFVISHF
jgi:hypothetical protein